METLDDLDLRNPDVIRARIRDLDRQIEQWERKRDVALEERNELHGRLDPGT